MQEPPAGKSRAGGLSGRTQTAQVPECQAAQLVVRGHVGEHAQHGIARPSAMRGRRMLSSTPRQRVSWGLGAGIACAAEGSGCAAGISSSGNASSGMRTAPLNAEPVADSTSNTASVIRRSVKRTGFIDLPEISGRQPPGASWVAGTLPFSGTPFSFSAAAIACGSVTSSRIRALPFDPLTVALFFR